MDSHTLIQALIYLGSAALIVPIAVRLGLGSVLGYLIAGCIIGPWGLRLVTDAESILHFAEIGVVLMLFVIGLELDPAWGTAADFCHALLKLGALSKDTRANVVRLTPPLVISRAEIDIALQKIRAALEGLEPAATPDL